MARYTITPWKYQSDLLDLRADLYSTDSDTLVQDRRRDAVQRVHAWKLRGNLPHAVESTALLVDAILHHQAATPHTSQFAIRAVYTAAFTRFVTGFCDIGRARENRLDPRSMLALAKEIGMPAAFVALRHEATHEEMPGLRRLVTATAEALDWLWKVYWIKIEDSRGSQPRLSDAEQEALRDDARNLVRAYRTMRRDAFKARRQNSAEHAREIEGLGERCIELCAAQEARVKSVTELLVQEQYLVPASKEQQPSITSAFLFWDALLQCLSRGIDGFLPALVQQFLHSIESIATSASSNVNEANFSWLLHIVDAGDVISAEQLARWCCLHPGPWSQKLSEHLLARADNAFREYWVDLFAAAALQEDEVGPEEPQPSQSAITEALEPNGGPEDKADSSDRRPWRRALLQPRVPIGIVS